MSYRALGEPTKKTTQTTLVARTSVGLSCGAAGPDRKHAAQESTPLSACMYNGTTNSSNDDAHKSQ